MLPAAEHMQSYIHDTEKPVYFAEFAFMLKLDPFYQMNKMTSPNELLSLQIRLKLVLLITSTSCLSTFQLSIPREEYT